MFNKKDKKPDNVVRIESPSLAAWDPPSSSPPPPPPRSLLDKEREKLSAAKKVLRDIQASEHNQHLVIAHITENVSRLEMNPWFEQLYMELRSNEAPQAPQELVDSVKRAQETGLLSKGDA